MSGLDLNFGGGTKASSGFKPIPEGTYEARIDNVEIKDTQAKEGVEQKASDGTPARYLNVCYKIIEEGDYEGRLVWGINSIRFPADPLDDTDKERTTREMFLSWLNTVTGTDFTDTEMKLDLKDLVGAKVRAVVIQKEWQGEPRNSVKKALSYQDNDSALENARRSL